MPAGMVLLMPETLDRLMTYQEGLLALLRPEAVMQPAAMVRMSMPSSHARADCPNMKSMAPTMRLLA